MFYIDRASWPKHLTKFGKKSIKTGQLSDEKWKNHPSEALLATDVHPCLPGVLLRLPTYIRSVRLPLKPFATSSQVPQLDPTHDGTRPCHCFGILSLYAIKGTMNRYRKSPLETTYIRSVGLPLRPFATSSQVPQLLLMTAPHLAMFCIALGYRHTTR